VDVFEQSTSFNAYRVLTAYATMWNVNGSRGESSGKNIQVHFLKML
jgi:hypothetical protein